MRPHALRARLGAADPYFPNVSLLLHCDGPDFGTTLADSSDSAKSMTLVGSSNLRTNTSRFGTASFLVAGSGEHARTTTTSTDFAFTGDYTIDLSLATNGALNTNGFFCIGQGATIRMGMRVDSSGRIRVFVDGVEIITTATGVITDLVWTDVSLTRQGAGTNNFTLYRDGTIVGQGSSTFTWSSAEFAFIGTNAPSGSNFLIGWIDEVRITKDVCRYGGSFPRNTRAFPDF